mmetsp:Transcript_31476/g.66658  ORF Transcript_31476/g.66658 Transcript_31476/m.66658 type:complete len:579 (-) Transcript_31476:1153-2889(-)
MTGTDVNHGGDELDDHQRGHEHEHAVHHDVERVTERVEFIVEQSGVEHFFQTRNVLRGSEERLVEIGGIPPQRIHDDLVQRGSQVRGGIVVQVALLLVHRGLPILVDALDVIGHVVHPLVQREPRYPVLVQPDGRVTQHAPLVIPQELGRAVRPGRERVARDPQQHVQVAEALTRRVGKIVVGTVQIQIVIPDLFHVETLLGQRHGRGAGEDLGGVLSEIVDDALHAPRMSIDQILHVVDDAVDDHPALPRLEPHVLDAEYGVLLAEQQGHEAEHAHEEDRARHHDEKQCHLLAPRLLGILGGSHDALVGDHEGDDPGEGRPDPTLDDLVPVRLVVGFGNGRGGEGPSGHDGGLGAETFGGPGEFGLGDERGAVGEGAGGTGGEGGGGAVVVEEMIVVVVVGYHLVVLIEMIEIVHGGIFVSVVVVVVGGWGARSIFVRILRCRLRAAGYGAAGGRGSCCSAAGLGDEAIAGHAGVVRMDAPGEVVGVDERLAHVRSTRDAGIFRATIVTRAAAAVVVRTASHAPPRRADGAPCRQRCAVPSSMDDVVVVELRISRKAIVRRAVGGAPPSSSSSQIQI